MLNPPHWHADREKGAALFLAILVIFILTVMGIGLMFTSSIENALAGTETKISKIFYAAESGVEFAGAMLSSQAAYAGGRMPVGVSTYYPGLSPAENMQVTISSPVIIGYSSIPGEPLSSAGHTYGSAQYYEIVYAVTSSATSDKTQATKAIDAEIGVYPKQLSIPK